MFVLLTLCVAVSRIGIAHADDSCRPLKWDVTRERTLFGGTAKPAAAGTIAASLPEVLPEQLYELAVKPQEQITLATSLKKVRPDGAFAGLARLHISAPGSYRISLARSGWIDVIGDHGAIAAEDFSGDGCEAPHKVVQFNLPTGDLLLQLSGVGADSIRLTVTRASQ